MNNSNWGGLTLTEIEELERNTVTKCISLNKDIERKCNNCFNVKSVSEFYRRLDDYQGRCKACQAEVWAGYKARTKGKPKRAYVWKKTG